MLRKKIRIRLTVHFRRIISPGKKRCDFCVYYNYTSNTQGCQFYYPLGSNKDLRKSCFEANYGPIPDPTYSYIP